MKSDSSGIQRPLNPWETIYAAIGRRLHQKLYEEVSRDQVLRPRLTLSGILSGILALMVDGLALVLLYLGLRMIWTAAPWNLFVYLIGLLLISLAFLAFPRVPRLTAALVPREQTPTLYQLADRIAEILGARPVDGIILDARYNASFSRVGWRQKRILSLGLPLLMVLDPQERIALLGHELAHDVNGDFTRNLFVGSAIGSLTRWYQAIQSGARDARISPLVLTWPIWAVIYLLSHLSWHESQRAEYLADFLAAKVGGSKAASACLQKLSHAGEAVAIIRRGALGSSRADRPDVLREFQDKIQEAAIQFSEPPDLQAADSEVRADATHPPLNYRIRYVDSLSYQAPLVSLSAQDAMKLDAELELFRKEMNDKLLESYESWLYR